MNAPTKIEASLHSAMAAAFGEIEAATKGAAGQVGQQRYKYADIGAVIEAVKPALIKHGLFFTQHPHPNEDGVIVETVLHHASGESVSMGSLFVPANKRDAQGFGSALTYARRYALVTAFGVPTEDDDGNAAVRAGQGQSEDRKVSPAPERISEDALNQVIALCEAVGGGQSGVICKAYNIEALPGLTAAQGKAVIGRLQEKLADKVKAESNKDAQDA